MTISEASDNSGQKDFVSPKSLMRSENDIAIKNFAQYLMGLGFSEDDVQSDTHCIDFFSEYLAAALKPGRGLLSTTADDIADFLGKWYPSKITWAGPDKAKYIDPFLPAFKHFFQWLASTHSISKAEQQRAGSELVKFKEAIATEH